MKPGKHGRDHGPWGEDPIPAPIEVRLSLEDEVAPTGDNIFTYVVERDLHGCNLVEVWLKLGTPGAGVTRMQIHNVERGIDMLSTRTQIDAGEWHSKDSGTQVVINDTGDTPVNQVSWGDRLRFDLDDSSGLGLKAALFFWPGEKYH